MLRETLLQEVRKIDWAHTIDLGDGVVTPGKWPVNRHIVAAFDQVDFRGKKVLDVGACNGLWSFEAERRGAAEVHSIDHLRLVNYWCTPGYKAAHEALDSKAIYNPDLSVYDVDALGDGYFDVVIFCGVYYHLKSPLLALAKLRRVLKTGGAIVIEGPVIIDHERCYAQFLYRDAIPDRSNWWVPTRRCLGEWIECSFFETVNEYPDPDPIYLNRLGHRTKTALKRLLGRYAPPEKRTVIVARGVARDDPLSVPDPDLLSFMSG
jgi:tRNA (mo5U34)-methyltransferase